MAEYLYNNDDDNNNNNNNSNNNNMIACVENLQNFVSESPFTFRLLYYRNF